jgi:hypothetical protein
MRTTPAPEALAKIPGAWTLSVRGAPAAGFPVRGPACSFSTRVTPTLYYGEEIRMGEDLEAEAVWPCAP